MTGKQSLGPVAVVAELFIMFQISQIVLKILLFNIFLVFDD